MRKRLLGYIRCPITGTAFELYPLDLIARDGEEDVRHGVLKSQEGGHLFPILQGVPILLPDSFPPAFLDRYAEPLAKTVGPVPRSATRQANLQWSFSGEWETFFDKDLDTTWGWTARQRLEMLFQEAQVDPNQLKGALVCDAGCGNGLLSEAISSLGATVIGIDYSTSVFQAEAHRRSPHVHFVRGDLQSPPLAPAAFDLIISNGVLHHTRSTRATFERVAELVRPGGRFYLWLYRRSRNLKLRFLELRDRLLRPVCSRLPRLLREGVVRLDAAFLWLLTNIIERKERVSYKDLLISSYDTLTPRYAWRHHTPFEVACWFFEKGFAAPSLTHWDNPFGFGMVAQKRPLADTPGVNFGLKPPVRRRYA